VRQIEDNIDLYRVPGRIAAALAAVLGGFALLLASVGIYGVVSYTVSRRIREIGIRVTLGARAGEVVRLMMRGAMIPVLCGALLGLLACMSVSRILSSVLYGINPLDPLAFAGVTLFLLGVALLASYVPARRAARVDPMDALRYE
jgi:putative ABC transport system permease protein